MRSHNIWPYELGQVSFPPLYWDILIYDLQKILWSMANHPYLKTFEGKNGKVWKYIKNEGLNTQQYVLFRKYLRNQSSDLYKIWNLIT